MFHSRTSASQSHSVVVMTCLVAHSKHDASRVFVPGIARKAGSPVRCQESRTLKGLLRYVKNVDSLGRFLNVFSIVGVLKCTFLYLRLLCSLCGHWILTSKVFLVRRTGLKDVPLSRHDDIQHTGPSRPHSSRLFVQKYMENNLQGSMLPKLEWPDWRAWNLLVQPWQLLLFCWELGEVVISATPSVVG